MSWIFRIPEKETEEKSDVAVENPPVAAAAGSALPAAAYAPPTGAYNYPQPPQVCCTCQQVIYLFYHKIFGEFQKFFYTRKDSIFYFYQAYYSGLLLGFKILFIKGPPGLPGLEGEAGQPGSDGTNGKDAPNGKDAITLPAPFEEPCLVCHINSGR